MADSATCPECGCKFAVIRYGRRIPCPGCGTPLDIMPEDLEPDKITAADWERAIRAKIAWLLDAVEELGGEHPQLVSRIGEEIKRLREFVGGD